MAFGFDTIHIGTTKSRFCGFVGIPTNYCYDTVQDVERADIQLQQNQIAWSTDEGKLLQESLVLTEDEQVFAMARSILQIQTHKLLMSSFYGPFSICFVYAIANYVNTRANLYARPRQVICNS